MRKSRLLISSIGMATVLLVSSIELPISAQFWGGSLHGTTEALARSSGGRSRGGSFRRSSPSRSTTSSPTRTNSNRNDRPYYRDPAPVIVPVPINGGPTYYNNTRPASTNSGGNAIVGLIILLLIGGVSIFVLWWLVTTLLQKTAGSRVAKSGTAAEIENDVVTITKLQVALLAQARDVQTRLNEIGETIDPDTPEGMAELLQEAALALLRTPENWSHVAVSSQTVRNREEAESVFNQLSVTERSKFSAETLVNVGGRVRRQQPVKPDEDETAAYIVVTLLIGTEHDRGLLDSVRSTQELQAALEKVAAISSEYLTVFELLWSPQDENDSLSYDELLTEYSEMVQI